MKPLTIGHNQVDIWQIDLARHEDRLSSCHCLLSGDELRRSERFHSDNHRRRFILAHTAMRLILGKYLNVSAQEIVFLYGAKGKPELPREQRESQIKFNLSHSEDVAVLAIAQGLEVGVDIEFVRPQFTPEDLVNQLFPSTEATTWMALSPTERIEAFFASWTRKEAYMKGLGEGLFLALDTLEVAFGPGIPASLPHTGIAQRKTSRWTIYDVRVGAGYKAALAVQGNGHSIRQRLWNPE